MKLSDIIKNINEIDDLPFFKEKLWPRNDIFITDSDGIHYFYNYETGSIKNKPDYYTFKSEVKKKYNIGDESFYIELYIAIDQLFKAVGLLKKAKNDDFDVEEYCCEKTKLYTNQIIIFQKNSLNFSQIEKMDTLIYVVKNNKFYQILSFLVIEYSYSKHGTGYKSFKKRDKYSFGNTKYFNSLDLVEISIYEDCVNIWYKAEGKIHEFMYDVRSKPNDAEGRILFALDSWSCYFKN